MSVDESTGRAAVERVLEGITETQDVAGALPGGPEARQWARDVAEKQIKIHEEREARQGIDKLKGLGSEDVPVDPSSASRLDRGEVPDDAEVINTALGKSGTPQAMQHMGMAPVPPEDQLMLARLEMLCRLDATGQPEIPEWYDRIEKAKRDGEWKAIHSGSDLDRLDAYRRHEFMAREVIAVLDLSSAIFGDWRKPKQNGSTKLMYMPLAK